MEQMDALKRDQLSRILAPLQPVETPRGGWIKCIRKLLYMPTSQLAKRLHVSQPNIYHLEKRESKGSITLETLSKVAEALECTLVYAFVPKKSFEEILESQALTYVHKKMIGTSHALEVDQPKPIPQDLDTHQSLLKKDILSRSPSKIWSDE